MARVYHRDAKGRFASGGGGSSKGRPATTKASMRGGQNRLTRDNSGRITSIGGNGATARGGRLKTAAGNQRGRQVARVKGGVKGTVSKNKRRDPNTPVVARRAEPKAQEFRIPKAPSRSKVGQIDDAKAGRIVARLDANRPGQRRASGSSRRTQNTLRTHERASDFLMTPARRARQRGGELSVSESAKRAVSAASKKGKNISVITSKQAVASAMKPRRR